MSVSEPFIQRPIATSLLMAGVLLLAKKRSALVELHRVMREGERDSENRMDKRYLALVHGKWLNARQSIRFIENKGQIIDVCGGAPCQAPG